MALTALRNTRVAACCVLALLVAGLKAQDPSWFRKNDKGNRYEGTLDRPHALKSYELLAFFAYRQDFFLTDDTHLLLRFYLPEAEPVYVSAREIRVETQYLMQPKPTSISIRPGGWCEFSGWPVTAVLKPYNISAENLGVIVRLKSEADYNEDIAPVLLLSTSAQVPTAIKEYALYLTVAAKLKSVDYEVIGKGYDKTYLYKSGEQNRSVEARTVIPLKIPAAPLPEGPLTIKIWGDYANSVGRTLNAEFRFYNKPL